MRVVLVAAERSTDFNPRGPLHFDAAGAFQTAWTEERAPSVGGYAYASGVLYGLAFFAGPRWSLDHGRKRAHLGSDSKCE